MIKDRNYKDLTEKKEIKKRGKNTQKNYTKKVVTHLQPDILAYETKSALGSITTNKASEGDGIPAEPLKILKDHAVKVLHSIYQQIWRTQQWSQDWKRSVFIPNPKKDNVKECSNCHTIVVISQDNEVMLKILQARFQQYMN